MYCFVNSAISQFIMFFMLQVENVGHEIERHRIFQGVTFTINKGDKIGLVGPNGVGKTTLLEIIADHIQPTEGSIVKGDYEVGILPQDLTQWLGKTVYEFVEEVTGVTQVRTDYKESYVKIEKGTNSKHLEEYEHALEKYNKYNVANFDNTLKRALALAGLKNINVDNYLDLFSGGQKTRIALAALFAANYDVVLLDEPTNNLDDQGMIMLEKFIKNSHSAFAMVSHDRRFLRNATSRIIELLGGEKGIKQYGLGYDEYVISREKEREASTRRYDQYETEKKRLRKAAIKASSQSDSASGQRSRSDNDKLNSNFRGEKAASKHAHQSQAIISRLDRLESPERPEEEIALLFSLNEVERKKVTLMTIDSLTVKYDNSDKVYGPLSLNIVSGDRVAITGSNGVGKTTLLKAIVGEEPIYSGFRKIGTETELIYMDQRQSVPLPDSNAIENLKNLAPSIALHEAIRILIRFNLNREIIDFVPVNQLSGGERAKIILASMVANKANLLVMDEPTNNLDIPTIEGLERALRGYKGSIIVVSHDRDFLKNLDINQKIYIN